MIVVTTGVPGSGKTLWAISWVKHKAEKEGREVYYSGIADLKLPWIEIDPQKWMDCPPNSIIVIDECQRVLRPRSHGSQVPEFVSALETHRHKGVDIVFIAQHPMLIDANVRRLCGLHFHVVRSWGRQKATVHEWPSIKENCDKNGQRDDSVRHEFRYPKEVFGLYKSAEVHTHKARIPYHVYLLALVPVAVGFAGWRVYSNWFPKAKAPSEDAPLKLVHGGAAGVPGGGTRAAPMTPDEYINQFKPRVPGLAYTAPAYDESTRPTEAPYPAACVSGASGWCKCWTQQGTRLEVGTELCQSIAKGGFFVAWRQTGELQRGAQAPVVIAPGAVQWGTPVVSLGSSPRGAIVLPSVTTGSTASTQ